MAQGKLPYIALTDLLYAGLSFTLIQRVAKSQGWASQAGFILGGVVGSVVSVVVTQRFLGV